MPRVKKAAAETTTKKTPARRPRGRKPAQRLNFKKYYESVRSNIVKNRTAYSRYLIILGIVLMVGVFAFLKKDWFVVAVVNREPITTLELYQNLKARNGQEVLNQLIRDRLIVQEANRQNIRLSQGEVDERLKEVEDQLGGREQLKSALAQSNISESDFRNQVRVQLLVEKILAERIEVSEEEIDTFIAENPQDPSVSGANGEQGPDREEIRRTLRSNKLNQEFQEWYQELEQKASISRFI